MSALDTRKTSARVSAELVSRTNRQLHGGLVVEVGHVPVARLEAAVAALARGDVPPLTSLPEPDPLNLAFDVQHAAVVADPGGLAARLRRHVEPFPEPLRERLLGDFHHLRWGLVPEARRALRRGHVLAFEVLMVTWARALEQAGVHVVYGVVGLKTHAKTCLVVRRETSGMRRYAHIGTGNYNPSTARQYEDLGLLTPANLGFVQVCDLAGVPRELATDADRILPGDGDFQLQPILAQLQAAGYDGWVSLELLNPALWQTNAVQVAAIGHQALQRLLENAC